MNRDEVITLLKKICSSCKTISPDSIVLTIPNPNNKISTGYRVRIKSVDQENKNQIRCIIDDYGLSFFEDKEEIVIYKPVKINTLL